MKFVSPEFLWASLLIAIPIIVHLFNFRRYKVIYFSRVKFLKEVTEDSKSGFKLKHLLVLISRILAILFLVFAFAQPFIPSSNQNNLENTSLIYIDNSYSMEAAGTDGNLLNEAKNKAIELVKSFEKNEKVVLFTSDLSSDQFRFYSPDDVTESIKKINFSPRTTNLTTVLNSMIDLVSETEEKTNNRIFLFSDFQKTTADLSDFKRAELPCYFYQPNAQQKENIYIDSVWFESPVHRINTPSDVYFRIQNQSEMAQQDLTVTLKIGDNQAAPKRISAEANSSNTGSFNFSDQTAGIKSGTISVSTSQLYFDDTYFFTYEIKDKVEILLVMNDSKTPKNLEQLYALDPYYHYESTTIGSLNQDHFKNKELIIMQNIDAIPGGVSEQLQNALKEGATVVLIPGLNAETSEWNSLLTNLNLPTLGPKTASGELSYFNGEDPLYHGVFETIPSNYKYPRINQAHTLNVQNNQNFITLFGFHATRPYMIYSNQSNGRVVLAGSSFDLSVSDFQNHALFAATFLRFAETASFQKPLALTIGEMQNIPVNKMIDEKNPIHLINTEMNTDIIPQFINTGSSRMLSFAQIQDKIRSSGFYDLTDNSNYKDILALNYNRSESDIACYTPDELLESFSKSGWTSVSALSVAETGSIEISAIKAKEYWRLCIIFSLLFIAIEILLLKLWKS
jgi:hypothetical protein